MYRVFPYAVSRTGYYLSFALAIFVITMDGSFDRGDIEKGSSLVSPALRKVFSFPAIFVASSISSEEILAAVCPAIDTLLFSNQTEKFLPCIFIYNYPYKIIYICFLTLCKSKFILIS